MTIEVTAAQLGELPEPVRYVYLSPFPQLLSDDYYIEKAKRLVRERQMEPERLQSLYTADQMRAYADQRAEFAHEAGWQAGYEQAKHESLRAHAQAPGDLEWVVVLTRDDGSVEELVRDGYGVYLNPDKHPDHRGFAAMLDAAMKIIRQRRERVERGERLEVRQAPRHAQARADASGGEWVLVPREATESMLVSGYEAASQYEDTEEYAEEAGCRAAYNRARVCWNAMIADVTGDRFCDANCVWSDHHPDCPIFSAPPAAPAPKDQK